MIVGEKDREKGQYACKGMLQVYAESAEGYREYMHAK